MATEKKPISLSQNLPSALLENIHSFLEPKESGTTQNVCRNWHISDFWKKSLEREKVFEHFFNWKSIEPEDDETTPAEMRELIEEQMDRYNKGYAHSTDLRELKSIGEKEPQKVCAAYYSIQKKLRDSKETLEPIQAAHLRSALVMKEVIKKGAPFVEEAVQRSEPTKIKAIAIDSYGQLIASQVLGIRMGLTYEQVESNSTSSNAPYFSPSHFLCIALDKATFAQIISLSQDQAKNLLKGASSIDELETLKNQSNSAPSELKPVAKGKMEEDPEQPAACCIIS